MKKAITLLCCFAALQGCKTFEHEPKRMIEIEAKPLEPKTVPVVINQTKPMPMAGQLKEMPQDDAQTVTAQKPWKVIESANRDARRSPDEYGYFNAIMQYDYEPSALYQIYVAPQKLTNIQLQPGEELMAMPKGADTVRFKLTSGTSMSDGQLQQHLFLTATRPGLNTNMTLLTNKRVYQIEVKSYKTTYMAAVKWNYPQEEAEMALQAITKKHKKEEKTVSTHVNIEDINSQYSIHKIKGDPAWTPLRVFDDGSKTYIEFPESLKTTEAPALFVLLDDETQLVNYRIKDRLYIVDRLFGKAELRVGTKKQRRVQIINDTWPADYTWSDDEELI